MCLTNFTCTKSVHQTVTNIQHVSARQEAIIMESSQLQHKAVKMGCCIISEYTYTVHLDVRKMFEIHSRLVNILNECKVDYKLLLYNVRYTQYIIKIPIISSIYFCLIWFVIKIKRHRITQITENLRQFIGKLFEIILTSVPCIVTQLVEALSYKSDGWGFDSRLCY